MGAIILAIAVAVREEVLVGSRLGVASAVEVHVRGAGVEVRRVEFAHNLIVIVVLFFFLIAVVTVHLSLPLLSKPALTYCCCCCRVGRVRRVAVYLVTVDNPVIVVVRMSAYMPVATGIVRRLVLVPIVLVLVFLTPLLLRGEVGGAARKIHAAHAARELRVVATPALLAVLLLLLLLLLVGGGGGEVPKVLGVAAVLVGFDVLGGESQDGGRAPEHRE